jgi:rubrerythrin
MNIIECAIKKEQEAKIWYEQLAADVTTPELKELFTILAASEDEHCRAIARLKADKGASAAAFIALDGAACAFRPLLDQRDVVETLKHDSDGFRRIIAEKEETIRQYEELEAQAGDEETRKLLGSLVAEEKRHLNIVENIFEFVESPRTYLAWGEFSNLKEY